MALEPHLNIQVPGITEPRLLMNQPVVNRIKEDPTARVLEFESQDLIVRSIDGQFRGASARGVTRESFQNFLIELKKMNQMNKNVSFDFQEAQIPDSGEVLLGVDLARSLGVFEGDSITLVSPEALLLPAGENPRLEKVVVRSIISTNVPDLDSQAMYYRLGSSVSGLSGNVNRGLEVWLQKPLEADNLKKSLSNFDNVKIETWTERNGSLFFALKMEKIIIGMFLTLAGLIAGSGILTVLSLLLSQKKRDIAILKTVGLSGKSAVKLFTGIGFALAMTGVVAGVIFGTSLGLYIEAHPLRLLPAIYYDSEIPAKVEWVLVFGVLIISALISWAGSWIPASIAKRIQPAEVLRIKN